jgi:PST family polysaccharide transporter
VATKRPADVDTPSGNLAVAAVRGTLWTYASTFSGKLLVLISTVILARLLLKEDFGVAGYALVIIGILDVLSDLGVGAALIYYKDDPEATDTAFWLGLGIALALFASVWVAAPLAGAFFDDERVVAATRVLALTFPLTALSNIHNTLLQKRLQFRRKFVPDLAQAVAKGVISIALALLGLGAWSLILGQVGGTALAVVAYWWAVGWRPSLHFSTRLAPRLLRYGSNIVATNGLGMLLLNADYLFVGRYLGAAALGAYMLAFRIPELLISRLCGMLGRVMFPVYARIRDEDGALANGFLLTLRYLTMITVPLALGLALVAEPLVLAVFGARWSDAIPVMQAIALYTLLRSLAFNIGDVYKAQGRPGILTRLALLRAAVLLPGLWWAASGRGSIVAVAWVQVVVALGSTVLSLVIAARLLALPFGDILAALRPSLAGGALMATGVLLALRAIPDAPAGAQLVTATSAGVLVYALALWSLHRDDVTLARSTLQTALSRR